MPKAVNMDEHIKYKKDGDIEGLYIIDVEKAKNIGKDQWDRYDQVIKAYIDLHPMEMKAQILSNRERRQEQLNKYGSTESKALRHGISIPAGLLMSLQGIEPRLLQDKKLLHKFMRRYPAFTVCDAV